MFHSSKCRVQFSQVYLKHAWGGIKKTNIKIHRVVRNMQSNLYIIKGRIQNPVKHLRWRVLQK